MQMHTKKVVHETLTAQRIMISTTIVNPSIAPMGSVVYTYATIKNIIALI